MIELRYDGRVDALAIALRPGAKSHRTQRITDTLRVDWDEQGRLVLIELLNASAHADAAALAQLARAGRGYTLAEAELVSGISAETLKKQLQKGRIRGEKQGRDWVVDGVALAEYMNSRASSGRPPASAKGRKLRKTA